MDIFEMPMIIENHIWTHNKVQDIRMFISSYETKCFLDLIAPIIFWWNSTQL